MNRPDVAIAPVMQPNIIAIKTGVQMRLVFVPVLCGLLLNPVVHAQPIFDNQQSPIMVADFVDDVLKGFLKGSSGNKSGSSIGKMFNAVTLDSRCQNFINWSGRLQQEYPNLEILRIRHNEQTDYYARLFDDAHFEPFFGQRYDEMSEGTLADIGRNTLMECMKSSTYKRSLTWQSQLLRAFPPTRQATVAKTPASYSVIVPKVRDLRQARSELNSLKQDAEAMPANAASYDRLIGIQKRLPAMLSSLWPSDQSAATEFFEKKRMALVEPALGDIVDQAIAGSHGYSGLTFLRELPDKQRSLFSQSGQAFSDQQKQRLQTAQDRILQDLMPDQASRAVQFASTPAGLRDGGLWYQSFFDSYLKYPEFRNHPAVHDVDARFWEKRNAAIAASEKTIGTMLADAKTPKSVRDTFYEYLWLDGDAKHPATLRLINLRQASVDKLIKSTTTTDKKSLDALPSNLERLRSEIGWYNAFLDRYAKDMDHPMVKELGSYFWQKRDAFINANKSNLHNRIATAQEFSTIDDVWSNYLRLERDRGLAAVSELESVSALRRERLKLKSILAGGLIDHVPTKTGEPTEEEMFVAVNSRLQRQLGAMESMRAIPFFDATKAFYDAFTGKAGFEVTHFRKEGCDAMGNKSNFKCGYYLSTKINTQGGMREVTSMMAAVAPSGNLNAYFEKSPSGWHVTYPSDGVQVNSGGTDYFQEQLKRDEQDRLRCMGYEATGKKGPGCL